mgnify:CR=1 FL=1
MRVFITGVGVVSSIGLGKDAFFRALAEGTSGISPVEAFDVTNLGRAFAGEAKSFAPANCAICGRLVANRRIAAACFAGACRRACAIRA